MTVKEWLILVCITSSFIFVNVSIDGKITGPLHFDVILDKNLSVFTLTCELSERPVGGAILVLVNLSTVDIIRHLNDSCYDKDNKCQNNTCVCSYEGGKFGMEYWYKTTNISQIYNFGVEMLLNDGKANIVVVTLSRIYNGKDSGKLQIVKEITEFNSNENIDVTNIDLENKAKRSTIQIHLTTSFVVLVVVLCFIWYCRSKDSGFQNIAKYYRSLSLYGQEGKYSTSYEPGSQNIAKYYRRPSWYTPERTYSTTIAAAEEFSREPPDRNASAIHISDFRDDCNIDPINKRGNLKSVLPASESNTFSVNSEAAEEFPREPSDRNASAIHTSVFCNDCYIDPNKWRNSQSVIPVLGSNTFSVKSEAAEEFPRKPSYRNTSAIHISDFCTDCDINPNKWRNSPSVLPVIRSNTLLVKSATAEEFAREPVDRNATVKYISDSRKNYHIDQSNKCRSLKSILPASGSNTFSVNSAISREMGMEGILKRKISKLKGYQDQWFILTEDAFMKQYEKNPIHSTQKAKWQMSIILAKIDIKKDGKCFNLTSNEGQRIKLKAQSKDNREKWIKCFKKINHIFSPHSSPDVAYDEDEDDVFTNKSNQKAKEDNPEPKLTTRKLFGDTFKSKDAFPKQNNDPRKSEETVNDPLKESAADITKKFKEMTIVDREKRHLMVAAIDIGSTFSGWAYSLDNPPENNVMGIGQTRVGSLKVPTVLLLDHDREFVAFGFRAEFIYSELLQNNPDEAHTCYYFSRFKMQLYNNMNLKKSMTIKDITGKKEMKAVDVFAYCIENIKDSMFRKAEEEVTDLLEYDIKWVLTVPAVWNEVARECMLEAAEKAGIDQEKLTLALEPEAAALYCKYSEIQKRTTGKNSKLGSFDTGAKFVVVDLGGGTVTITLNEVLASDQLKVIHSAYCGPWGGNIINERIWKLLQGVFGENTVTKFIAENRVDYLELARTVELKKRTVKSNNKVSIEIPRSLMIEAIKTNPDIIAEEFKKQVKLVTNKLQVLPGVLPQIFKEGIDTVSKYVQNLLDQPESKGVSTILLVGGYAACDLLKDAMKTNFKNLTVICPLDSDVVVLKGAVIMGHMETPFVGRISKCH